MLRECGGPILLVLGKTRRICIPPAILCVEICFVVQFSGQNHGVNACTIPFTRTKLTLKPLYCGVLSQGGTPTRPSFPRCREVWKCVLSLLYCFDNEALARGARAKGRAGVRPAHFLGCPACWKGRHSHHAKGALLGRRNILESQSRSKFQKRRLLQGLEVHFASRSKGKSGRYCMVLVQYSYIAIVDYQDLVSRRTTRLIAR